MNKELRQGIWDKCLEQMDTSPPDNGHDVEVDFKMARLEEDRDNDVELFKLKLKHELSKGQYEGEKK